MKNQSGSTDLLASKQLLSLEDVTCAAALVPPDPKPDASLTCMINEVNQNTLVTHENDRLMSFNECGYDAPFRMEYNSASPSQAFI